MLGFIVLVSALLAGFGMAKAKTQSRLHVVSFAAIVSAAIYLIIDLEFPRLGLLRVDDFDHAFVELRRSME
jgi:fumarate reductase subunit D